jgi:hypothetical protein
MTVMKFYGYYEGLQNLLALTGIGGVWRDLDNQKQYVANTGAILNWWRSTKTVNFQGGPPAAKQELEAAFFAANQKEVRACKI